MTTTTIIVAVLLTLFTLVAITFVLQQIEKNNREKRALVAALKSQTRNFNYLLEGFPEGFLNRDLKLLVGQCLEDCVEQLLRLEPRNPEHQRERRQLIERLAQLRAQQSELPQQPLTDPAQIQEVQKLLKNLINVVQRLHQNNRLTAAQADQYVRQVQGLATRAALDSHLSCAQQAGGEGKFQLAVHYLGLAIALMTRDNADGTYTLQIAACQRRSTELELQAKQQDTAPVDAVADEWREFDAENSDGWKKKAVYD